MYRHIALSDIVDIGICAIAVYGVLVFGFRTASRRSFAFLVALVVAYSAAVRWQMHLTLNVFRFGFLAAVIAIAIVYQDDLRALAERIGRWIMGVQQGPPNHSAALVTTLADAAFHLAASKTGALIVVRGHDELERLIDGGIPLDAKLSAP